MSTSPQIPEPEPQEPEQDEEESSITEEWGGDGFPDLPEHKQTILKSLLRKALTREVYSRRTEVIEARQQRF